MRTAEAVTAIQTVIILYPGPHLNLDHHFAELSQESTNSLLNLDAHNVSSSAQDLNTSQTRHRNLLN